MAQNHSFMKMLPAHEAGFAVGRQELVRVRMDTLHQTLANVRHALPNYEEHATQTVGAVTEQAMKLVERADLPEAPKSTVFEFPQNAPESALEAARKAVEDARGEAA